MLAEEKVITVNPERFREMRARYNGTAGCGHIIQKGDIIGYDPGGDRLRCEKCWRIIKKKLARNRDRAYRKRMKVE